MLRTSGGRGEYELAGSQGDVSVANVANRWIAFSITPEITIPSRSRCLPASGTQGKPRIRLENKGNSGEQHGYLVFRALLLLPEPIRELSQTGTGPLELRNARFSINAINVDVVSVTATDVVLRPTAIEFRNAADHRSVMGVPDRMAKVMEIWRAADELTTPIAELVKAHREIVLHSPQLHTELSAAATNIQHHLGTDGDCIELLANALNTALPTIDPSDDPVIIPPLLPEEDPTSLILVKRKNVKTWRKQYVRGPEAAAFRRNVRLAYNSRCAFSGVRLPKLEISYTAGVDAAHILPWSQYNLNRVSNGLCLSKLFHWAFDNGIVRLDCLPLTGRYELSIPNVVHEAAAEEGMDLSPFTPFLGTLPNDRFPTSVPHRPRREFLEQLNAELF